MCENFPQISSQIKELMELKQENNISISFNMHLAFSDLKSVPFSASKALI